MITTRLDEERTVSQLAITARKPISVISEVALVVGTLLRLVVRTGR